MDILEELRVSCSTASFGGYILSFTSSCMHSETRTDGYTPSTNLSPDDYGCTRWERRYTSHTPEEEPVMRDKVPVFREQESVEQVPVFRTREQESVEQVPVFRTREQGSVERVFLGQGSGTVPHTQWAPPPPLGPYTETLSFRTTAPTLEHAFPLEYDNEVPFLSRMNSKKLPHRRCSKGSRHGYHGNASRGVLNGIKSLYIRTDGKKTSRFLSFL